MNYKDYTELLNEKLTSEIKKINLLYTNDSTKELKVNDLKREYGFLKLINEEDLRLFQASYLFRKYSKIKESTTFCSFNNGEESYADAEKFITGTINLLPFFMYKYIKVSTKNGMLLIESKKLDKLLENIKDNIAIKRNEENGVINYSNFMSLLNSHADTCVKTNNLFHYSFCAEPILKAYEILKCKNVDDLTEEQKIFYIKMLKRNLNDEEVEYFQAYNLFIENDFKIVPFFSLKYLEKEKDNTNLVISRKNYMELIKEIEASLEDNNNGGGSSMSLKPRKSKSLEI